MLTKYLDLTKDKSETTDYKLIKFPGGEIHFVLKNEEYLKADVVNIVCRLNSSDDIITLALIVDTFYKALNNHMSSGPVIWVIIPYMPYQQADRDFGIDQSFSLDTITRIILNPLHVHRYQVYMPHSDITPALLRRTLVIDDSKFIRNVISKQLNINDSDIVLLSPDAGAYKRIGKLARSIAFGGPIAAANKYRELNTGNIESIEVSVADFKGQDVLIVDDLCMGGNTFISLSKKLRERNVGNLYLAVSHMVSQNINPELLESFTAIFCTNSRYDVYNDSGSGNLFVYDIINDLTNDNIKI